MADWIQEILEFWFDELQPKDWWNKNEAVDKEISERFRMLWDEQRHNAAGRFLTSAHEALSATILFDQFPRNMFRGNETAFSTDPLAQQIAEEAVERGFDQQVSKTQRPFVYMPFMHAEDLRLQEMSVELFGKLGSNQKFAEDHHAAIARFGRFPHRNAVLGRKSLKEERQAVADGASW